jgi:hypothetical protein
VTAIAEETRPMRNAINYLALLAAATAVVGACDEEDQGDPCQRAAAVEQAAADEFCAVRTDACCLCACWSQTAGYHDVDTYLFAGTCECIDPPPADETPAEEACEGQTLEDAQACLDDEEACVQPTLQSMQVACDASAI